MKSVLFAWLILVGINLDSMGQPIDHAKADSIAALYPGHPLNDLGTLSQKLTGTLPGDVVKFRAIFKWVCSNIRSDYDMMELNRKKIRSLKGDRLAKWNKQFSVSTITKLIDDHTTVCTGYAWLVRELALRSGINCEMVYGYGKTTRSNVNGDNFVNHTWNAVELDGKWYLCDPAWSSGVISGKTKEFKFQFTESYFLADPEMFILRRYPVDKQWTLLDNSPELERFLDAPLIIENSH